MPNVPQFKKNPPIADPVTAEVLRQFFKEDDDWTQFVATIINSGLLTRQLATNVAVPITAGSVVVSFAIAQQDTSFMVTLEVSWNTTTWLTAKTKTGFTVNFGTAAPASATFSWAILR